MKLHRNLTEVQALTIRSEVNGCLEGVFALGQIYVLASRVTDPANLSFVGLPPKDLLADVAQAWTAAGLDANACFDAAAAVTDEWEWERLADNDRSLEDPGQHLQPQYKQERRVPLQLKTLHEVLNPQPTTAHVLHGLLDWIKLCDDAARKGDPPPEAANANGGALFPSGDWWLTELEKRKPMDEKVQQPGLDEEVVHDEQDLTQSAADAWWHADTSDSSSSDNDSNGSLPAGPSLRKRSAATGGHALRCLHRYIVDARKIPRERNL